MHHTRPFREKVKERKTKDQPMSHVPQDAGFPAGSRLAAEAREPDSPRASPRQWEVQPRGPNGLGLGSAWLCHQPLPAWGKSLSLPGF